MPSRVEALIRNFLKTDSEALCLVLGERLYLTRGGAKTIVGREPLSEESFHAIADELAPGELVDSLVATEFALPFGSLDGSGQVDIRFGLSGGIPSMTVVRAAASGGPLASPGAAISSAASGTLPLAGMPAAREGFELATDREAPAGPGPVPSTPKASMQAAAITSRAPAGGDGKLRRGAAGAPPSGAGAGAASAAGAGAASAAGAGAASAVGAGGASAAGAGGTSAAGAGGASASPRSPAASAGKGGANRPIDRLLIRMLAAEASDLHLSAGNVPVFRVHGVMLPQADMQEHHSADIEEILEPVIPERNLREFEDRSDTDFAYEIEGVGRFRVNVFRDRHGVGAVFRQIPIRIQSAAELNLPPAVLQLGELSKGLVLVTGPTGSGKSTTLAALIDHINQTRSDHIITIEDPVEFTHPNKKCLINQREVGSHTRSFKDALRAALREDPDILMVGEMRDLETISIALETAETGHLVFGTLHTTTAISTVDRIVDQFPADRQSQIRVMLAESLRAVVSQTLLKKKGGGRVAALEVLLSNGAVANLIRDSKTFQLVSVMQTSKAQGMMLLNDSLVDLVRRGVVEAREAYMKATDKAGLLAIFRTLNIPAVAEFKVEGASPVQPFTVTAASSTAR